MSSFPPTIILRHRKENLKKCTLRGLEERPDFRFYTYPLESLPDLSQHFVLTIDAPPLGEEEKKCGIFLLDGTWRYAGKMQDVHFSRQNVRMRSLPAHFQTAYPRVQNDCPDPMRGLASIEAIFITYFLLGRETAGLLDHYYWKDLFLEKNHLSSLSRR